MEHMIMGKNKTDNNNFVYWQSAGANNQRYLTFLDQITNIALSRFQWFNLPDTCNERYLETVLLHSGMATISKRISNNHLYSLRVAGNYGIDMYGNIEAWYCLGDNGFGFNANWSSGAVIYENLNRTPIYPGLKMYAYELADLMALKLLNRQQQKAPYIITGPESKKNDMVNLYKQIAGNEPAVLANPDISTIEINALSTGVEYIADKIDEDIENTWRKVYGLLGVNNAPYKAERQIESEVMEHSEPSEINRLSPLVARQQAVEWINKQLGYNIQVEWRRDWDGKSAIANFNEMFEGDENATTL
ncbi:hypothetical protein [Streptomyces sp. ISID311]|uniref:hypothetical protein n=1 Tax=Streptomyces sp. ISID311 TaxID=2601673 RepID=UPI00164CD24E|nr:hypothetical protein [Streptomyces sp. ISID311]